MSRKQVAAVTISSGRHFSEKMFGVLSAQDKPGNNFEQRDGEVRRIVLACCRSAAKQDRESWAMLLLRLPLRERADSVTYPSGTALVAKATH